MPVPPLPFVALPGINLLQVLPWNNLINLCAPCLAALLPAT